MAEAVGLGASILTFITVAAGLSKANAALYGSIKDAPSDVQSVQTRLKDLEFILTQIGRAQAPAVIGLTRVAQIVDDINATMVTKQEFADHHNALRLVLKFCIHTLHTPQST